MRSKKLILIAVVLAIVAAACQQGGAEEGTTATTGATTGTTVGDSPRPVFQAGHPPTRTAWEYSKTPCGRPIPSGSKPRSNSSFEANANPTNFNAIVDAVYTPDSNNELDFDLFILGWSLGNPALPTHYEAFWSARNDALLNGGNNSVGLPTPSLSRSSGREQGVLRPCSP